MLANRTNDVPVSGIRKVFNKIVGRSDILDLTVGLPDFDTPQYIKEAAIRAIDEGYTRYTHNAGYIETREAMAVKLKRDNNIDANPETEIMMTVGGMGALLLTNLVLVNPGDDVIYPDPGFVSHYSHIKLAGGNPIPIQLKKENDFGILAEDVEECITDKTKLMVLNSPNNPTGGVTTNNELKKIAALAIKHDFVILADEAYEQFTYGSQKPLFIGSLSEMKDRVVSLFSLSKTYAMTGWRIGAATGPAEIISSMTRLQEHVLAMPTSISQKAAEAAVLGDQKSVREMLDVFRKRRDIITKGLNQIEGVDAPEPGGAFYVFPDISKFGLTSEQFAERVLENAKVATIHGSAFGKHGEGFLRMCYAVSTDRIEQALQILDQYLPTILPK